MDVKESAADISLCSSVLQAKIKILEQCFNTKLNLFSVNLLSEKERRNTIARLVFDHSEYKLPRSVILKQSLPKKLDTDDKMPLLGLQEIGRVWNF